MKPVGFAGSDELPGAGTQSPPAVPMSNSCPREHLADMVGAP